MGVASAVSVVIPNFNRAHSIGVAVASALAQTGADLEVLVCDDGSTDSSESVVRGLCDPRVRWLPGAHSGGPSGPRNRGIAAATGDWVAFLDSDDAWLQGKLAAQLTMLREAGACTTNAFRCVPGSDGPPSLMHERLPASIDLGGMLASNRIVTSAMVVSTSLLREVGGFPEVRQGRIFEDYALWLRVAQRTPIAAVNKPLVSYRDDTTTSVRGGMNLELVCTRNALLDFRRWRAAQRPRIGSSLAERIVMARQLSALVSVRKIGSRSVGRLPTGCRGSK